MTIASLALEALMAATAARKGDLIATMHARCAQGGVPDGCAQPLVIALPGLPQELELVQPRDLKRRSLQSAEGKACFLHAIAHIEFNAINLALDAVYRFPGMPRHYYLDWLRVAAEEVDHHQRLVTRLADFGYRYGDFPAHNGLWDIAVRTAHDLLGRMALVPCVFEARGLDVTPPMISKMQGVGDRESAAILQFILDEEVAHVEIGVRWFDHVCRQRSVSPVDTFMDLVAEYLPNKIQGPLNREDRLKAGFTEEWLTRLDAITARSRNQRS